MFDGNTHPPFQSHNGAIAAENLGEKLPTNCGFNPTMVRLLHARKVKMSVSLVRFQSHNGAIAAMVMRDDAGGR